MADFSDSSLTFVVLLSLIIAGGLCVWLLRRRWTLPQETRGNIASLYGGGLLIGAALGLLFTLLAPLIFGGVNLWVFLALPFGMLIGAWLVPVLPLPSGTPWQIAAFGLGGILLGGLCLGGFSLIVSGGFAAAPAEQTATFTPPSTATDTPTPTETDAPPATATTTPIPTATVTPTAAVPALPSNFNIPLTFSNSDCGYGDFQSPFTFDIQNSTLTITQLDAGNVTSGPFDPLTGEANTFGTVAGGQETYSIIVLSDGSNITVAGFNSYTGPNMPQPTCSHTVFGQTSIP